MRTPMVWMVTGKAVEQITVNSPCYQLPRYPPSDDFVVFVDGLGTAYRWGDARWRIGAVSFNFGYEPTPGMTLELTRINGELLKRAFSWFVWGDRRAISCNALGSYFTALKPIFAACSRLEVPIAASDIGRFFGAIEAALAAAIRPSSRDVAVRLLHELWDAREWLGFELLSPMQIARLRELIPDHETEQTQFIPPRIWAYQAGRMREFLEDFIAHKPQLEAMLLEIADAHRTNFGSLSSAAKTDNGARNPCQKGVELNGCVYLGRFADVASRHGVADVIARWLFGPATKLQDLPPSVASVRLLSAYFNAVGIVGSSYLQCFSGMRLAEALSLRSNCLSVEHDSLLGDIHILSGETTKTTQDLDARWMTAPAAALAVAAMSAVARWRTDIAAEVGMNPLPDEDRSNPYLVQRGLEPWGMGGGKGDPSARPAKYGIQHWRTKVPGLFADEALRITAEDELYVRRFSANVDMTQYGQGCIWHLTSHQYRRSIHVLMAASNVSLPSRQQQLKHLTSSQSAYYARGHENLRLNRTFGNELVSTRYELVAVDAGLLNGPDYVSPHGEERKSALLNFFEVSSRDEIVKAQKRGRLTIRQTVLGICTASHCQYGGFDNYVHCPDCVDGLMDKRKRPVMEKEGRTIAARLIDVPTGTPLRAALEGRAKAIERFMNVTA